MTFFYIRNNEILSAMKEIFRKMAKLIAIVIISAIFLCPCIINSQENLSDKKIPFSPGEKIIYHGRWGPIEAGEITLEVFPNDIVDGVEAYHFVMTTKTNALVDMIYKIRQRQDSWVDIHMTHSLLYKNRIESKHPRDEIVTFNWNKNEVTYTNFGQTKKPTPIPPGTFDPLGFFFATRMQNFKENTVIDLPFTDGNNTTTIARATVGERVLIEINGKNYDTYEIYPDIERIKDAAKRKDSLNLKMWLTADKKKIPVKIQTKVGIITFDFDIVSISP